MSIHCRSHWPGRLDRIIETHSGQTLYEALRKADQPIASSCTAESVCGKCIIEVLEGKGSLTGPSAEEKEVLAREGAGPSSRLACRLELGEHDLVITTKYW